MLLWLCIKDGQFRGHPWTLTFSLHNRVNKTYHKSLDISAAKKMLNVQKDRAKKQSLLFAQLVITPCFVYKHSSGD